VKTIPTTLIHRILLPGHSSVERHPAILMLHGRGSDEEDLLGMAPELDERFLLLSARAPLPFPYGGYTWFPMNEEGSPDAKGFHSGLSALSTFVDDACAGYPIDPSLLFLFGFSMGSIMSYALAGTRPGVFRGVVANSGFIPESPDIPYRWKELTETEFFVTHGTEDPVIPVSMARRARELLSASGARFVYREYPVPHTISEAALREISAWLSQFLTDPH
jgi:phospholipase/carboxylesterase